MRNVKRMANYLLLDTWWGVLIAALLAVATRHTQ